MDAETQSVKRPCFVPKTQLIFSMHYTITGMYDQLHAERLDKGLESPHFLHKGLEFSVVTACGTLMIDNQGVHWQALLCDKHSLKAGSCQLLVQTHLKLIFILLGKV